MSSPAPPRGEPARSGLAHRLRALPSETTPPFGWGELQRRARRRRQLRAIARAGSASLAACCVLALTAGALWMHLGAPQPNVAEIEPTPPADAPVRAETMGDAATLLARAEAAERWLSSDPDGGAIVHVSTGLAIARLEDRIASVDDQLDAAQLQEAGGARLRSLRLERARLIDDLARVRYAETLAADTR